MARRLAAVGIVRKGKGGPDRLHVWQDARGWWSAPVLASPDFAFGPFDSRTAAEQSSEHRAR